MEEDLLTAYLTESGYTPAQIRSVLHQLRTEADNPSRNLYGNNQAVLDLVYEARIISTRKAKAIVYEEYLKRISDLVRQVDEGVADDTPELLKKSSALRALYNNLKPASSSAGFVAEEQVTYGGTGDPVLDLALRIDDTVKRHRPDGWRGVHAREMEIKQALYYVLEDTEEVERIFLVVKAQDEY